MNEWDRNNLNFLLAASAETLNEWHQQADEDDIAYAMELLKHMQSELILQELALADAVAEEDLTQAQTLLNKFRL